MGSLIPNLVHFMPKTSVSAPVLAGDSPAAFLTPEALMSYCETRLRGIDERVKQVFVQQQKSNDDANTINWLNGCLGACAVSGIGDDNGTAAHDVIRAYQAAIGKAGPETALGKKLLAEQTAFIQRVGGANAPKLFAEMSQADYWSKPMPPGADKGLLGDPMSGEEIKVFTKRLDGMQQEVSAGAELNMVSLQSLMSQRQMAIQLATNLVQSLGEMTNKIAANIGH